LPLRVRKLHHVTLIAKWTRKGEAVTTENNQRKPYGIQFEQIREPCDREIDSSWLKIVYVGDFNDFDAEVV